MNIEVEEKPLIIAKTSSARIKKITYSVAEPEHALGLDKKEILTAEIEACERSLKYAGDEAEKYAIENELSELRLALDLMS